MTGCGILLEELQPATAALNVVAGSFTKDAGGRDRHGETQNAKQLLVNCGDYLQLREPVDGTLEVTQSFHLFERVEHIVAVPASLELWGPASTDSVLLFTVDGRCALFRLQPRGGLTSASSPSPLPAPRHILTEAACLTLPMPPLRESLLPKRLQGVTSTAVARLGPGLAISRAGARGILVAAAHMGALHVITLHPAPSADATPASAGGAGSVRGQGGDVGNDPLLLCSVVLMTDTPMYDAEPGTDPLEALRFVSHVRSLALLPRHPRDPGEPPLLAVLHAPEGTGGVGVRLDCLALHLGVGAAPPAAPRSPGPGGVPDLGSDPEPVLSVVIATGPWVAHDLHPTTCLLAPFGGSVTLTGGGGTAGTAAGAGLPAGVLAFGSRAVSLYGRPPPLAALAADSVPVAAAAAAAVAEAQARATEAMAADRLEDLEERAAAVFAAWFGRDPLDEAAFAAAQATVRREELAVYDLPGLPTCVAELAPGVFVIADSAAGLHLLHAAGPSPWCRRLEPGPPGLAAAAPCVATALGFLPGAAGAPVGADEEAAAGPGGSAAGGGGGGPGGLLFAGSSLSNSQVLVVPASLTAPSAPAPAPGGPPLRLPLAEMAAVKSLAPVLDVALVPDAAGAPDPWLVAACGSGSAGRLVRGRLAAGLQPCMSDGPQVPDGCRMFAVRLGGPGPSSSGASSSGPSSSGPSSSGASPCWHTHVAFSFDAAGRTDLLSVGEGGEFLQVSLPGLDSLAPSLLVADVGGTCLVQATQTCVRLARPLAEGGALSAEWKAPGEPLSLAAHAEGGCLLAVAGRSSLHLLQADPAAGSLQPLASLDLPAQLSALALCRTQPPNQPPAVDTVEAEAAATVVLMGQWVTNRVEALSAAALAAAREPAAPPALLSLQLGESETPRSLALLPLPGPAGPANGGGDQVRSVLLAGTNEGRLLLWPVGSTAAAQAWRLGPCRSVRLGEVAIEMLPYLPSLSAVGPASHARDFVYLHSSSGAVVRARGRSADPGSRSRSIEPDLDELVEVARVHGSEGLQALCHVSTPAMPDSAAWVTPGGRLLFGRIDPRVRLRWTTAFVGESLHSLAFHAASRCLLALCEAPPSAPTAGAQSLRLIHADTLQQVLAMRLAPGHYHNELLVAALPCTSAAAAATSAPSDGATASHDDSAAAAGPSAAAAATSSAAAAASPSAKEFVLLASHLLIDSASDPKFAAGGDDGGGGGDHVLGRLQQGMLSFLEVVARAPADGTNATQYSLVLHGTCTIPAVANALGVARAAVVGGGSSGADGGGGAGGGSGALGRGTGAATAAIAAAMKSSASAPGPTDMRPAGTADESASVSYSDEPYLVAGCHDGVYVFQVHVDDGGRDGTRAVNRALKLATQMDELRLPLPHVGEGGGAAGSRSGGAGGADEDLAEDESELPEVPRSRRPASAAGPGGGADTDAGSSDPDGLEDTMEEEWEQRGRDAMQVSEAEALGWGASSDDQEEGEEAEERAAGRRGPRPAGAGAGGPLPEAARARRALRAQWQREAEAGGSDPESGSEADADADDDADFPAGAASSSAAAALGRRPLRRLLRDLERDWGSAVTLRQAARSPTFGRGVVTALRCWGGGVAAADFLGSVTVLRLLAGRRGVALVPASVDRRPMFAQAFLALSPRCLLLSVHPHGLALLRRDEAAEERAVAAAAQQEAAAAAAAGPGRGPRQALAAVWEAAAGGGPAGARLGPDPMGLPKLRMDQLPGLDLVAACRPRQAVTRMCRAPLGLGLRPHDPASAPAGSPAGPSAATATAGAAGPADHPVLCFTASGAVLAARVLEPRLPSPAGATPPVAAGSTAAPAPLSPSDAALKEALTQQLALQGCAEALPPSDLALITGVDSYSFTHPYSWPLVVPHETAAAAGLAGGVAAEAGEGEGEDTDEEARLLAEGCADGGLVGAVLRCAEGVVGAGGGSGAVTQQAAVAHLSADGERVLRRLAEAVVGKPDVGALAAAVRLR
ncbi:hypothetical protein HYH03_000020 [Edaphochlamys debaryana]|uniref:Cleavage/polyadenylation specificity factor A subunit N-terminal domain-containing protein n=1 Tax=Edaphochlamys debaryana TaxID=47281 RepID=A0A835YF27_9CHLO|nr:hypothetical protein HYH03_000020 [Edaphochlamys debaryana]|eukprot:KAG2501513.1 hypothetical protein HYH03_000020 [Edaphochlamys debaryana]